MKCFEGLETCKSAHTIKNDNGHTTAHIGHDMNDPDIQTVL